MDSITYKAVNLVICSNLSTQHNTSNVIHLKPINWVSITTSTQDTQEEALAAQPTTTTVSVSMSM